MSKELPAEYLLASNLPFGGYRKRSSADILLAMPYRRSNPCASIVDVAAGLRKRKGVA